MRRCCGDGRALEDTVSSTAPWGVLTHRINMPRLLFMVNFGGKPNPRTVLADARAVPAAPYQHLLDDEGLPGDITRADIEDNVIRRLGTFEAGAEVFVEADDPNDFLDLGEQDDAEQGRIWWRATVESDACPTCIPSYTLDGEVVDIEQFIACNTAEYVACISDEEVADIRALLPGQEITFGGGAAAEFVFRRVE